MNILLDGKANFEELFAELGAVPLDKTENLRANSDRILPEAWGVSNLPPLPDQGTRACVKNSKRVTSIRLLKQ